MTGIPSAFPRRILLATVGLVPQVVTETLYALCHHQSAPFVPTEIHIITTAEGEEQGSLDASRSVTTEAGAIRGGIQPAAIGRCAHTGAHLRGEESAGAPLRDISTEYGNAALADLIIKVMHDLKAMRSPLYMCRLRAGARQWAFCLELHCHSSAGRRTG